MTMHRTAALAAIASVVLLTGCGSWDGSAPAREVPQVESEEAASTEGVPQPEPVVSQPPSPFDAAPLSSQTAEITSDDGYEAVLTVEWLPTVSLPTSELPTSCVAALTLSSYQPSWTDADVSITATPFRIAAVYPAVNGFTWPEEAIITGHLTYVNPALRNETANVVTECVDGVEDLDIRLPGSGTGGTPVEAFAIFFEPKTPNNPDGTEEITPGWLSFETAQKYDWSCNQEREFTCVFPHP